MVKHYVARTVTKTPDYMQAKIVVPAAEVLHAGQVVVAEELDASLGYGNWDVYTAAKVSDETKNNVAIILNGGFETLSDGRRPDGNPDYTNYIFNAGDIATAIVLKPEIKFEISYDAISNGTDVEGLGYLIPEESQGLLKFVETLDEVNSKVYLKVEALKEFRLGGLFGGEFAKTMVVRVKYTDNTKPADPEITEIQAEIVQGLQVGNNNVKSGSTVLTMQAQGGTAPYTYELIPDGEVAQDNNKFVIDSSEVKVGAEDLTEAKTYKIYVQATDSKGKIFKEGFDIPVAEA